MQNIHPSQRPQVYYSNYGGRPMQSMQATRNMNDMGNRGMSSNVNMNQSRANMLSQSMGSMNSGPPRGVHPSQQNMGANRNYGMMQSQNMYPNRKIIIFICSFVKETDMYPLFFF